MKLSKSFTTLARLFKFTATIFSKLLLVKTSIAVLIILILGKPILSDILTSFITNLIIIFMIFKIVSDLLKLNIKSIRISRGVLERIKLHLTPLAKFIAVILLAICLLTAAYYYKESSSKCVNPYEVKDSSSRKEAIRICNNILYKGSTKVVGKNEYPDLFEFLLEKDSKPDEVRQYVRVFEKDKQEYISIKSLIDYTSWNNSAIGIYQKEGDEYKLIFKKTFSDNQGRWVNIEFGEDSTYRDQYFFLNQHGEGITISGDIGYLGCSGRCRLLWWDFYDWDSSKKTFVLANNKHPDNFKRLLEDYEQWDKVTCSEEASVAESISSLYPTRKNKESVCTDNAGSPYTNPAQAEMLLKGIKAIELIINGENIPMAEVDKVKIDL